MLGVPKGRGGEGSLCGQREEREQLAGEGAGVGVPLSSGDLCPAAPPLTDDQSCGRQVAMYLGRLEPKHWGTSLSASKWQRSS